MNFVHIAGHLGADPEVRFTTSGQKVTTLRVAARVRRGGQDATIWWRVTIWGEQYDKMIPFLKKGSAVIVIGEMSKPEIFTTREGTSQVSMNLTALHLMFSPFGRGDRTSQGESSDGQNVSTQEKGETFEGIASGNLPSEQEEAYAEDEIPF